MDNNVLSAKTSRTVKKDRIFFRPRRPITLNPDHHPWDCISFHRRRALKPTNHGCHVTPSSTVMRNRDATALIFPGQIISTLRRPLAASTPSCLHLARRPTGVRKDQRLGARHANSSTSFISALPATPQLRARVQAARGHARVGLRRPPPQCEYHPRAAIARTEDHS